MVSSLEMETCAAHPPAPPKGSMKMLMLSMVFLSMVVAILLGCSTVGAALSSTQLQQPVQQLWSPSRLRSDLLLSSLAEPAQFLLSTLATCWAATHSSVLLFFKAATLGLPSALISAAKLILRVACKPIISSPRALLGTTTVMIRSLRNRTTTTVSKLIKYILDSSWFFFRGDLGTWETAVGQTASVASDYLLNKEDSTASTMFTARVALRAIKLGLKPVVETSPAARLILEFVWPFFTMFFKSKSSREF